MEITARELYEAYPRHLGKNEAIRAIKKALRQHPEHEIWKAVKEFAASPAGRKDGLFPGYQPPYPATWFNQGRYLDDTAEWGTNGHTRGNCAEHPKSGLTEWGTCWGCYAAKYSEPSR